MRTLVCLLMLGLAACSPTSETKPDVQRWSGDWLRSDGTYRLNISISGDGVPEVAYFNPKPIQVEKAEFKMEAGKEHLIIVLRDVGYPGAVYDLRYHAKDETLVGTYNNPNAGQPFQVSFFK